MKVIVISSKIIQNVYVQIFSFVPVLTFENSYIILLKVKLFLVTDITGHWETLRKLYWKCQINTTF